MLLYNCHQKHWESAQGDFLAIRNSGSQLENENMSPDCGVCGVTVHTHVYTSNSHQVKETLLYIQVMTQLLSTWSLFALNDAADEDKQTTSHLCLSETIWCVWILVTLISSQEPYQNHVWRIAGKWKDSESILIESELWSIIAVSLAFDFASGCSYMSAVCWYTSPSHEAFPKMRWFNSLPPGGNTLNLL